MLHKCATQDCPRRFKYFGVGLLFVEPRPKAKANDSQRVSRAGDVEFFWLCEECARRDNEQTFKRLPVIVGPEPRRTA